MTTPEPRSYAGLAVAIVAAALIVGASIYVAFSGVSTTTVTDVETQPVTTTVSTTTVCLCPTAPAPCPCASQEGTTSTYGGGGLTVVTTMSTGASVATTTTNVSNANDLQLSLGIRSNGGANITISADESNLLDSVNNVTTASDWQYPNTGTLPCGNWDDFPVELAILPGNYGASNYTSGGALTLYSTTLAYSCVTMTAPEPYLLFAPLSDNASYRFSFGQNGSYIVSDQLTTSGYWTGDQSTAAYHPFPPGSYTVLAEDEWGDVVLLHFDVVVTTVTETMNSTVSSTNGVNSSSSSSTCTAATPTLTLCHTTSTTYEGAPTNSSSTTTTQCTITAEGSGFYLTVLSDSGQPIQGARVTGTRVTEVDSGTCQQAIGTYSTNSTGSVLITPNIGSYYVLSVMYEGANYTVNAPIRPMTTTYVTLNVPSGNVTISEVFEGGCQTSSGGVTCPG